MKSLAIKNRLQFRLRSISALVVGLLLLTGVGLVMWRMVGFKRFRPACSYKEWETTILKGESSVSSDRDAEQEKAGQPFAATLVISLVRNEYDGALDTYKPILKIRADGYEADEISGHDVGYAQTYRADCAYYIQLLAAHPAEARIRVARKVLGGNNQ